MGKVFMTTSILLVVLTVLVIVNIVITATKKTDKQAASGKLDADMARLEPLIRDESARTVNAINMTIGTTFKDNREELNKSFVSLSTTLTTAVAGITDAQKKQFDMFSEQLNKSFKDISEMLIKNVTTLSQTQNERFDTFSKQLDKLVSTIDEKIKSLTEQTTTTAKENRTEQTKSLDSFRDNFDRNVKEFNEQQRTKFSELTNRQDEIKKETENKLKEIRETVEKKLTTIQEDNNKKLEEMKKTVDEKLQESINKRFNESFELISKRLEEVQKGLGEMQTLASDVGGLKRVLTNVKTRGAFGEVQLESLLIQILSPEQYEMQAAIKNNSQERVDAVVKLPGQIGDDTKLLLPIDSKFPVEDYHRLSDAYEKGEAKEIIQNLRKEFEKSVKSTAKSISEKYINPPATTDFAIMFVPSEGIYAEILRSVELLESLRRDFSITIVGPTNLAAFLSSLRMGFNTLTIQKSSGKIREVLGAVKSEFGKFGVVLNAASKQLRAVENSITKMGVRTRGMERALRDVEKLPQEQTTALLGTAMIEAEAEIMETLPNEQALLGEAIDADADTIEEDTAAE
jgi:DNA recombination protein RmuC